MGAGEGSRGGKVVGHTRSGRPIYASSGGGGAGGGSSAAAHGFIDAGGGRYVNAAEAKKTANAAGFANVGGSHYVMVGKPTGPAKSSHAAEVHAKAAAGHDPHPGTRDHSEAGANRGAGTRTGGDLAAKHGFIDIGGGRFVNKSMAKKIANPAGFAHVGGDTYVNVAGGSGGGAKGADFNSLRNKGHDMSERAFRTGSAEDHQAALKMQTRLAGMAKGSPEFQKYHLERADQHREALGEKLRPRGNLDRPAVLNKPGYKPR